MSTLHGKGGMVYLQGSGAAATKLGEVREWSIDIDKELAEDTAMGDTWRSQLAGIVSWSGSIDGNLDTAETSPFDAAIASSVKAWYLYPNAAAPTLYYYGSIWPTLSVSGGLGGIVSFSLSFEGDGALSIK